MNKVLIAEGQSVSYDADPNRTWTLSEAITEETVLQINWWIALETSGAQISGTRADVFDVITIGGDIQSVNRDYISSGSNVTYHATYTLTTSTRLYVSYTKTSSVSGNDRHGPGAIYKLEPPFDVAKVVLNGVPQIDLTGDTVDEGTLLTNYTAHANYGTIISGSFVKPSGTLWLYSNGIYDVYSYSSVSISTPDATLSMNQIIQRSGYASVSYAFNNITKIGSYAFAGYYQGSEYASTKLVAISCPNVTMIDTYGFSGCLSLTSLYAPLLTSIREGGMQSTGLLSVTDELYPNLESIGAYAFRHAKIQLFSNSLITTIPDAAFYSCSIISINCPGVTSIQGRAFESCSYLTSITSSTFSTELSYIGAAAFHYCSSLSMVDIRTSFSCGSTYSGTAWWYHQFHYCSRLATVNLPYLSSVARWMFGYCYALSSISIPNATYISECAFTSCRGLPSIVLPEVTTIGSSAFQNCVSLTYVEAPKCTSLGAGVFNNCQALTSISFPVLTSLSGGADLFKSCYALEYVHFPLVTSVTGNPFNLCSSLSVLSFDAMRIATLYSFGLNNYVEECYFSAASRIASCSMASKLKAVYAPECTFISGSAFSSCSALVYASYQKVSAIDGHAFRYCAALPCAIFGPSAEELTIADYAFYGCYNLLSLYILHPVVASLMGTAVFTNTPIKGYTTSTGGVSGSVFVPESLYSSYIAATNWAAISARIVSLTDAQISNVLQYGTHEPT